MMEIFVSVLLIMLIKENVSLTPFTLSYSRLPYSSGTYSIKGYIPDGTQPKDGYALHIWVAGTSANSWDYKAQKYTSYMAQNGLISASVFYNNGPYPSHCEDTKTNQGFLSKAQSIFDSTSKQSAISVLCNNATNKLNINCSKGVVINGFSQGAQIVSLAPNYTDIITGVYEMGGGDVINDFNYNFSCLQYSNLKLNQHDLRSMVGENDEHFCLSSKNNNGCRIEQIAITGYTNCATNAVQCLQSDGSGWFIVQKNETASGKATHCYSYLGSNCGDNGDNSFDTLYYQGCKLQCQWSFESNLQWLVKRTQS